MKYILQFLFNKREQYGNLYLPKICETTFFCLDKISSFYKFIVSHLHSFHGEVLKTTRGELK